MSIDPILPPVNLGFCSHCACWLTGEARDVLALPNGQVIPADHPQAAEIPIMQRRRMKVAPCTLMPQWLSKPASDWCQQWRVRK
jgi:hypothetical protein